MNKYYILKFQYLILNRIHMGIINFFKKRINKEHLSL